jgi:hypothetical protein
MAWLTLDSCNRQFSQTAQERKRWQWIKAIQRRYSIRTDDINDPPLSPFPTTSIRAGWIEFSDKKIAKQVAESLNNTAIGGKKGDFYHDDIWNLKYLKKFK